MKAARALQPTIHVSSASNTPAAPLAVKSWHWSSEYGYAIAEGTVRNTTAEPIDDLEAVVEFNDNSGSLIKAGDALIEYKPLMPGQSSPWKVMASYNPLMKKASLTFKRLFGGVVDYDDLRKIGAKHASSPYVADIQARLLHLNYTIDGGGVMNNQTKKAIMAFERDYRLPITGKASAFVNAASSIAADHLPIRRTSAP